MSLGCYITFNSFDIIIFQDAWTPLDDIENIAKQTPPPKKNP